MMDDYQRGMGEIIYMEVVTADLYCVVAASTRDRSQFSKNE